MTYYLFFSVPAPVPSIVDFYLLRPVYDLFGPRFGSNSFALRERLGGGNFGITYEAVLKNRTHPVKSVGAPRLDSSASWYNTPCYVVQGQMKMCLGESCLRRRSGGGWC
jgi:hypothetical protein